MFPKKNMSDGHWLDFDFAEFTDFYGFPLTMLKESHLDLNLRELTSTTTCKIYQRVCKDLDHSSTSRQAAVERDISYTNLAPWT